MAIDKFKKRSIHVNIALAHLIPAPFTQQVGRALHEAGMLNAFFCTLVDEPSSKWQACAKRLAALAKFDLAKDLKRRAVTEIPANLVRSYPAREAVRMTVNRLFRSQVVDDHIFHWARDGFDRWVAGQLDGLDGIYGYEYGSLAMFTRAKQLGLKTIYDLPSPEHDFVERLLESEYARFPELKTTYRARVVKLHEKRTGRRQQEWELADLIVANSTFTADSWKAAGWSAKNIAVVPYGAPPISANLTETPANGPLRVLWAGTFGVRKGAHYLIEAVESLNVSPGHFTIDVYGALSLPSDLMARCGANFNIRGSVPRAELFEAMRQCDLLVFPTLCDGFGLVVNEAFSQGLPVLTTRRAGAADLVRDGENGWLIEQGSATALAEGLRRCLDERANLANMREAARQTAAAWQWSDYRREIASAAGCLTQK